MKKYVIFGFDMETDMGSYLKTYNGIRNGTNIILSILEKYGIKATFLFTGDAALSNKDKVIEIAKAGYEVGCHGLKHETVGDASFNMPNDNPILEVELEYRLKKNVEIIKKLTGKEPVSFRAPRLWQGHAQVKILEKLGFKVDASYSVANYKKQIIPYHPSEDNWLEDGKMSILEIPNFAFLDSEVDYSKYFCKNDQWPLLRLLGADFVFEKSKYVIEKQRELSEICVLLFYLHPWEFVKMPKKFEYDEGTFYFKPELYENCGKFLVKEFEKYVTLCLKDGFEFTSCEEFYNIWEVKNYID
ncbi:polysaccharide deacetylase family protein [Candidatus Aerophobetes bacterium]|nr:polysaccharide deacetylase family protein [Candidatus Aerophobetes bacterium]